MGDGDGDTRSYPLSGYRGRDPSPKIPFMRVLIDGQEMALLSARPLGGAWTRAGDGGWVKARAIPLPGTGVDPLIELFNGRVDWRCQRTIRWK